MRNFSALLLLSTSLPLFAQNYRPFPEGNAGWVEQHAWLNCCGSGSNWTSCTRSIQFGTDTVVNGFTYHELRSHGLCTAHYIFDPWPDWIYADADHHMGFIRQDTIARRVYLLDEVLHIDSLLYDFSIGLGTYPPTAINAYYPTLEVVAIDSIELADGYHRRWVLNATNFDNAPYSVIEGIGSTFGVLGPMGPPFEWNDDLICSSQAGATIYVDTLLSPDLNCDLAVGLGTLPSAEVTMLAVVPDPVVDLARLSGAAGATSYRLVNMAGAVVMHGVLHADHIIDLAGLPPGPYAIEALFPDGRAPGRARLIKL